MYKLKSHGKGKNRVQLMGSGTILREVMAAQELLEADWGVASDLWASPASPSCAATAWTPSATCCTRTRRSRRWLMSPSSWPTEGPIIASTDYMKLFADQIRPFVPKGREYKVLGTDGFGRSDFRSKLREHFEVDHSSWSPRCAGHEGKLPPRWPRPSRSTASIEPTRNTPEGKETSCRSGSGHR